MALAERLALLVEMNPTSAVKGLTKVGETAEKQLSKVDTKTAKIGKTMSKVGVGMIGVGAVIGGVLVEAAEKAGKAEFAQIRLENSVKNSGNQAKGSAEQYEKLAKSIQSKTAASRIDIIAGEATLVQFGATTAQVKGLTPLVVDLARKQGLDLTQANKLVGKALEGSTGALKKAGIVVDETAFATDRYKAIVDALRKTVGGFAETEGKTFEGSLARLKNELTDIEAGVGKGAVDAFTQLLKPVERLSGDFENLSPKTQESVGQIAAYSAGGLLAVGTTVTLAGKILTMKDNFARLSEELPSVATGLTAVGIAGAAFAAIKISNAVDDSRNPIKHLDLNNIEKGLLKVGQGGKATGDLLKAVGPNFIYFKHAIEGIAAPSVLSQIEHGWETVQNLGHVLNSASATSLPTYKAAVDKVDKALAAIGSQSGPAAQQILSQLKKELGTKDYARLYPLLNDTRSALAGVAVTAQIAGDPVKALASAVDALAHPATAAYDDFVKIHHIVGKNIDPIKELTGTIDGLVASLLGLEGSQDTYQKDLNALPDVVKAVTDKHLSLKNALTGTSDEYLALRGTLRGEVDDAAKVVDSLVQQGASSDVVKAKVAELSTEFQTNAAAAGLPQPVIDRYLQTLATIPPLITTTVDANTTAAAAKIDALIARERILRLGTSVDPNFPQLYGGTPPTRHALGGLVSASKGYLVGEWGPEYFKPRTDGTIIPHNQLAAQSQSWSGPLIGSVTIKADSSTTGKRVLDELRREVRVAGGLDRALR